MVVGPQGAEFTFVGDDLVVETVEVVQRGLEVGAPELRDLEAGEKYPPPTLKRSETAQGLATARRATWTVLEHPPCRTSWSRERARSRSARTTGPGSQIDGTTSRPAALGGHPGVDPIVLSAKGTRP